MLIMKVSTVAKSTQAFSKELEREVNAPLSRSEMLRAFDSIVKILNIRLQKEEQQYEERFNAMMGAHMATMKETHSAFLEEMKQMVLDEIPVVKDGKDGERGEKGETGGRGEKGDKGDAGIAGRDGRDGRDGKDGTNGKDADEIKIIEKLEKDLPMFGTAFRDGLELLQGDERLDAAAIKNLEKYLKEEITYLGGGATGGRRVTYYDLSDSLDGSTKVFSLPAFYKIISVHSSAQPFILRPTTDYTTDGATMQITFTSAVDETITLATGQSLLIVYAES